jgi:hypothetical protein
MWSIGFLIISGLYNIISQSNEYDLRRVGYYHPVFGVKVLLALVVFFIASALVGRSTTTQKIRDNRRFWLTLNLVLAIIVVCLSGVLRMSEKVKKPLGASAQRASGEPARIQHSAGPVCGPLGYGIDDRAGAWTSAGRGLSL